MEIRSRTAPGLLVFLFVFLSASPLLANAQTSGLTAVPGKPLAPDFELASLKGRDHRLSDYRGKVVVVNFWATWCPSCLAEMPSMNRAWRDLSPDGFVLLAVNVGEDRQTVEDFAANFQLAFPVLLDPGNTQSDEWSIWGLPTTFIVDPRGRIAYRAVGGRDWDDPELMAQIRALQIREPQMRFTALSR